MTDNKQSKATHKELCDAAMKHYNKISIKAGEHSSLVTMAIEFFKRHAEPDQSRGTQYWKPSGHKPLNKRPEINTEVLNELDDFLQGVSVPKGMTLPNMPVLTPEEAFTVIYVLQEWLQIIPENFERCSICATIYDTDKDGVYSGDNEDEMQDLIDAGYDFKKEDIQKHFCGSCK